MPMIAPRPTPDDLAALFSALIDGTITLEDQARLEQRLREDRAARDAFRDFMQMESILAWELVKTAASDGTSPGGQRGGRTVRRSLLSGWPRAAAWLLPLATAAAAAAVVVAIRPTIEQSRHETPVPTTRFHARLVDATDAVWADGSRLRVGEGLADGPLHLVAGAAQVRFESGAVVTLNAPSEIEVLGDNRLFLRSGKIMPFVPPAAKGFTVVSPTGEVIDLGTEFSVSVDPEGRTDVYVVDGEVDVAKGHTNRGNLLRMTQGFGTRLTPVGSSPKITERPFVIDDFDATERTLRWRNVNPSQPATVAAGELSIPVEHRPHVASRSGWAKLILDHDFSGIWGRRSAISFKVTLPSDGLLVSDRWLACVVDDGQGDPPMAFNPRAALAVLVSPDFQAGVRVDGAAVRQSRVFARSEDAIGPYQVLMTIDDTPAARRRHGSAVASVTVNGQELLRDRPVKLGAAPRIGLQTFTSERSRGRGRALVDDFSVSFSSDGEGEAAAVPPTVVPPFMDGERVAVVTKSEDGAWHDVVGVLDAFYRTRFPHREIDFYVVHADPAGAAEDKWVDEALAWQPTVVLTESGLVDSMPASQPEKLLRLIERIRHGGVSRVIVVGSDHLDGAFSPEIVPTAETDPFRIACAILKAQCLESRVAESVINWATSSLEKSDNCSIIKICQEGPTLSWVYHANALPFPTSAPGYAAWRDARAAGVPWATSLPFDDEFNTERVAVIGAPVGRYSLDIDGTEVGVYSADELQTGVNVAAVARTPQNVQARGPSRLLPEERRFVLRPAIKSDHLPAETPRRPAL